MLLVMLIAAIPLAGCSSSRTHGSQGSNGLKPTTTSTRVVYETHAVIAAAVHDCKQGADMARWLPVSGREQLEGLCDRGRRSGLAVIAESAREVCGEVAFTSPSKSAPARARVLAECQAATKGSEETTR